jgi:mono/diheme cytochrome c family protein
MAQKGVMLLATIAVAAGTVVTTASFAGASESKPTAKSALVTGRQLYRQYCGKCHALATALAAGFGSAKGYGELGGPSFDQLQVPYAYSVQAVTEPTGGHELLRKRINSKQLHIVARWLARVTAKHPVPAFPTDG